MKLTCNAASKVRTNETITKMVAMSLVDANIFCICLNGPMRKHVLRSDMTFPNV